MKLNYKYLPGLGLTVINVFFSLLTLNLEWSSLQDTTMGLNSCTDCDGQTENWSWECFAHDHCALDDSSATCELYDQGYNASFVFQCLEFLSICAAVLLAEKLALASFRKDFGHPALMYGCSLLMFLLHLLAVALYFGFSEAAFQDCDSSEDSSEMCAKSGPAVSILNLLAMVVTVIAVSYLICKYEQDDQVLRVGAHAGHLCFCSTRMCVILQLSTLMFSLVLIIGGCSVNEWVETSTGETGSLLRCQDCDVRYEWFGYDCLEAMKCAQDAEECDTFQNLNEAGSSLMTIELIVVVLILLHLQSSTALMASRDYGIPTLNYVTLTQIYAGAAGLLQVAAIIAWFSVTEAGFGDCSEEDSFVVCSTAGPVIVLVGSMIFALGMVLYILLYWRRGASVSLADIKEGGILEIPSAYESPIKPPVLFED